MSYCSTAYDHRRASDRKLTVMLDSSRLANAISIPGGSAAQQSITLNRPFGIDIFSASEENHSSNGGCGRLEFGGSKVKCQEGDCPYVYDRLFRLRFRDLQAKGLAQVLQTLPLQTDKSYRVTISTVADVVTPTANERLLPKGDNDLVVALCDGNHFLGFERVDSHYKILSPPNDNVIGWSVSGEETTDLSKGGQAFIRAGSISYGQGKQIDQSRGSQINPTSPSLQPFKEPNPFSSTPARFDSYTIFRTQGQGLPTVSQVAFNPPIEPSVNAAAYTFTPAELAKALPNIHSSNLGVCAYQNLQVSPATSSEHSGFRFLAVTIDEVTFGCDGEENSYKQRDSCGVCGGDGSSCASSSGKTNGDQTSFLTNSDSTYLDNRDPVLNCTDGSCCQDRHDIPNYLWDWLLFPVAVDDLVAKLEDLSTKLEMINNKLEDIDFDQIPSDSGLNFRQMLTANYEWLRSDDLKGEPGAALVPFDRLLDSIQSDLAQALLDQSQT